ncbi:hypothetical protein GCM10010873_35210 [Cypionkella aquatica]|uniref:Uncharacterized protein n=1 Tax=Cypionkella aquatica TaxID=1756042 RepID=A0AA37X262_9RHOB|nr:hypothetical protein [Cypionkella aquatica]GLS88547.1 hypothetical protein GCM10010873_35210 [Cypionkella aquatica]
MLIVTQETTMNQGVLDASSLPKKFFGRVLILPRGARFGQWLRLIVEIQALRYGVTLLPFALTPFFLRDLALPVMEAPALMLALVAFVELKVLRLSKSARSAAITEDEAARRLDTLTFRARACLRRIAARHGLSEGQLRLVVEQSELARFPPMTLVSVQSETPAPQVLSLDAKDRVVLENGLFDADFTERDLLVMNQRDDIYLRDIAQETRAVSAHSRLAAFLEQREVTA